MSTGTLRAFWAGVFEQAGLPAVQWGSLVNSVKDVSITPKLLVPPTVYTVAVGEKVTLWEYDADRPNFSYVGIWLPDQSGNIDIGIKYVQASDMTSNVRWRTVKNSCHAPFILSEDEGLVHPTPASDYGETGSYPTIWGDASTVAAKVSKIATFNPAAATVAVRVGVVVIGG
jgi:hypothetical protein